jgi:hypothetical protein
MHGISSAGEPDRTKDDLAKLRLDDSRPCAIKDRRGHGWRNTFATSLRVCVAICRMPPAISELSLSR